MFSEKKNSSGRKSFKADLKFSIIFGTIFWITALILYLFVFVYIYSALRDDSRTGIQVRMLGYWAIDQSGGLDALKDNIDISIVLSDEQPFFVRIADEFNNTELLEVPDRWNSFDFSKLEQQPPQQGEFVVVKSPSLNFVLETGCIKISEGRYLQVGVGDENRRRIMELLTGSFLLALLILVAVSSTIGFLVAHRFLLPIRDLEKTIINVIDTGNIENRIVERSGAGELDQLVVSFNGMLEKIEELVVGMKGALDTVAHDLRTPLTRFRMISENALSRQAWDSPADEAEDYRTALEQAVVESETVLRMMTMLMDISEAETGTLKLNRTDFIPLQRLREIVDVYEFAAEDRNIKISIDPAWDGELNADADRFRQAAGNLIDNALKYGNDGGNVKIGITADDDFVSVRIADDGSGIAENDISEIWKRLYRGKSSKDGLGLGLSLVNAIMKAHGGSADVSSSPGRGAVFTIKFPRSLTQNLN